MNKDDIYIYIILIMLVGLIGVAVVSRFISWYGEFEKELSVINTEIGRTTGKEKKHWQKRKCRLLWSIIPFIKY